MSVNAVNILAVFVDETEDVMGVEGEWEGEIVRIMREMREKRRGYADFFEAGDDRKMTEAQVARQFLKYLQATEKIQISDFFYRDEERPDVRVILQDGSNVGIEITEFVNGAYIAKARAKVDGCLGYSDWFDWSDAQIICEIENRINVKNRKILENSRKFSRLVLILYTDEASISGKRIEDISRKNKFIGGIFNDVYFLLSYDPSVNEDVYPEGYPIIRLN